MAGLSRQIQQLCECERSCVIFHVIVLLLFMIGVLLMVLLMKEVEMSLWERILAWYKCQPDDFILSVMENGNGGGRTWCCSGSQVPKAEIFYSIFQNQGTPSCLGAASSCLLWPGLALPCHALSCLVLSCLGLNVTLFHQIQKMGFIWWGCFNASITLFTIWLITVGAHIGKI